MHLYLTSSTPWNSTYTTEEGQVIYRVESPFKLVGRTATIQRVVPNFNPNNDLSLDEQLRDQYAHLAQIQFNTITPSTITYGGEESKVTEMFRKEGWSYHGRNRIFTGPDGKEYKWKLKATVPELYLNDNTKTKIACFHRRHLGVFCKSRPASLEILLGGEHMVDLILVTFVYIEKLRKAREDSQKYGGS